MEQNLTRKELSGLVNDYEATLQQIYEIASDEEAKKSDLDQIADLSGDAIGIEEEEPDEEDEEE